MAVLEARTDVRAECICGWILQHTHWWRTYTWEEAVSRARAHACTSLNGRWNTRLWPQLKLELS